MNNNIKYFAFLPFFAHFLYFIMLINIMFNYWSHLSRLQKIYTLEIRFTKNLLFINCDKLKCTSRVLRAFSAVQRHVTFERANEWTVTWYNTRWLVGLVDVTWITPPMPAQHTFNRYVSRPETRAPQATTRSERRISKVLSCEPSVRWYAMSIRPVDQS